MSRNIVLNRQFQKLISRSPHKIQLQFKNRLELFLENDHHPLLNNHRLTGKLKEYYSINVTGDWRALYSIQDDTIVFEVIGTHSQLYK